jgi:hypothetical protein
MKDITEKKLRIDTPHDAQAVIKQHHNNSQKCRKEEQKKNTAI